MGTRYFVPVVCPDCGNKDDAYYAPTCGFVDWTCQCGGKVDLEKQTGITFEDASTRTEMEELCKEVLREVREVE